MKKVLVATCVLLLAVVFALPACTSGGTSATTGGSTATSSGAGTADSSAGVTSSSGTVTTLAPTSTTAAPQSPLNLKYATTFSATSTGGKVIQHFRDYVKEKTAGVVTFEINFGGVLGNSLEELGLVGTGEVEMVSLHHTAFVEQLPLLNFPSSAPPDAKTALAYFNYLVFDNADTAAFIQAEAAARNILILGFAARGGNVFVSKDAFTGLSGLVGKKFGASSSIGAFKALNYTVVQAAAADARKNLSAGTISATQLAFATALQQKCYEVAKNYLWDGTYSVGDAFTINLDAWYKMTPATQQIMRDAAKDASGYSLDLLDQATAAGLKTMSDAGATVGSLSAADQAAWWKALFASSATDCMTRAERLGVAKQMAAVLQAAADFTKVNWTAPAR